GGGVEGGSPAAPGPITPSPLWTAQPVQLSLQDSPLGQPAVEKGGSHASGASTTPSPHEPAAQPVQVALQDSPAGQPVRLACGSHTSGASTTPSPHVRQPASNGTMLCRHSL